MLSVAVRAHRLMLRYSSDGSMYPHLFGSFCAKLAAEDPELVDRHLASIEAFLDGGRVKH
jgi:hypothetical protein